MRVEKIKVDELNSVITNTSLDEVQIPEEKNQFKVIEGGRRQNKAGVFVIILLVFCAFFAIISRYGHMTKLNYEIADLKEALTTQNAINSALFVELEKHANIMKIRKTAKLELGMQEPDKYQIVYIEVPLSNSVQVFEKPKSKLNDSIGIFNYVKNFFAEIIN